jgi:hypothetical protein
VSIQDWVDMLKDLGITTAIYPLAFPASSPTEAMTVEVGNASSRGSVYDTTLTVTVRAKHPSEGERLSLDVMKKLNLLTDRAIGEHQIIMMKSQGIMPQPLGKDVKGNHYYMNNFRVLVS